MTRAARQKAERQATAAYAASQPLFDSLRIAFVRVGEQKQHLSIARDIVQNLHVHLPDPNSKPDIDRHERYIDCAVKAWRSASEVYSDVFESLAKATAAVPEEGRAERDGHAMFAEMARTATAAKETAKTFKLYGDTTTASSNASTDGAREDGDVEVKDEEEVDEKHDVEEDDDNESNDASDASSGSSQSNAHEEDGQDPGVDTTPTNPILLHLLGKRPLPQEPPKKESDEPAKKVQRLSDNIKYDAQGRKILWDKGAEKPNVPYGTLGSYEKKAWKAEKRRQKREKKQSKRAAKVMEQNRARGIKTGANGEALRPDRRRPAGQAEDTSKPAHQRDYMSLNGAAEAESMPNGSRAEHTVPSVKYADVSEEVDARLKAKEEKKAAMKKEKKRKRDSGDSFEGGEVEGRTAKPDKKRAKSHGEAESNGANVKEKRKIEQGEDDVRKKRRKA